MTAGELRKELEGVPDDAEVIIDIGDDGPFARVSKVSGHDNDVFVLQLA